MFELEKLVRENIKKLVPYSSARKEFGGAAEIYLDANENNFGSPLAADYHRYPDPLQRAIKSQLAAREGVRPEEIFVGNGSDEAIDLLYRIFCEPRRDRALVCPPTYGMYEVSADINDVAVRRASLTPDFALDRAAIRRETDERTKLLFLCSPNNPTGNAFPRAELLEIVGEFPGIAVVDEAYIHFSREESLVPEIGAYPNLVVLRTFSKAWGLAGLRVGLAFANEAIVGYFNKVKPPYNVSEIAQKAILEALAGEARVAANVAAIIDERETMRTRLAGLPFVRVIYPTDANFLLVKTVDAPEIYRYLLGERIVVRNRDSVTLCEGCLRITVGTPAENAALISTLEKFTAETRRAQRIL